MTPPHAARRLVCAATLLLALGLTACGDEESPVATPTTADEVTPETLDKPEQQELDATTAEAALPTLEDMPDDSWLPDRSVFSDDPITYEPEFCGDVELDSQDARTFNDDHRSVREEARFSAFDGERNEIIAAYVESYDEPYPLSFFDAAGEHTTDCESYTRSKGGHSSERHVKAISLPEIGDRSFGVRLWSTEGSYTDRLYIRSGHNRIIVMATSHSDTYDGDRMSSIAEDIIDDLKESGS